MPSRKRSRANYRRYARRNNYSSLLIDPESRGQMILDQADSSRARGSDYSRGQYGISWSNAKPEQRKNRMLTGFKGRGDYWSTLQGWGKKYIPRGTFASSGKYLGGLTGIPGMGALGSYAGHKLSNLVGFGDYGGEPESNQLIQGGNKPITVNASDDLTGDIHIAHREFIGNVQAKTNGLGVSTFSVTQYALNPGLQQTFPWLSQIAQNYTLYEFMGCIFEYKPTSGEGAGTTNALGKVVMATNYDPNAAVFTTSTQMESYDYAQSVKPSVCGIHGVETANSQQFGNMQYIRSGQTSRDKIFTDIGTFQIATEGITGPADTTINVGELWVTYKIKLSRANLFGSLMCFNQLVDQFYGSASGASIFGTTQTTQPLLTEAAKYPLVSATNTAARRNGSSIGCTLTSTAANSFTITFPPNIIDGVFEIQIQQGCPAATTIVLSAALNCAQVLTPASGSSFQSLVAISDAAALISSYVFYIRINAPGVAVATVSFGYSALVGANAVNLTKITCLNQNIL